MLRIRSLPSILLFGTLLFVAGCADGPTAPAEQAERVDEVNYGLLGFDDLDDALDLGVRRVTVLERSVPLDADEIVSKSIGRDGGIIRLPEAGLTVLIPSYAVSERTLITVKAPAGNLVGYHFEPHGLEFRRPVTMIQNMDLTDALTLRGLSVAYFDGPLEPEVTALESISLWILRMLGVFRIEHFSGYVIATN